MNEDKKIEEQKTEEQKIPLVQKNIRTYESDVAEALSHRKTSIASIAIAEHKKEEGTESLGNKVESKKENKIENTKEDIYKRSHTKQIVMLLLSVILIGGGLVGAYYLYLKSPLSLPPPEVKPLVIPSIIPGDKQTSVSIENISNDKLKKVILPLLEKNSLEKGQISELILQIKSGETTMKIPASDFIRKINVDAPDVFIRSLQDRWMLGIYTGENGTKAPLFIFTTDFFQNTFAGMLSWEESMPDDLAILLGYKERVEKAETEDNTNDVNASSSAPSTDITSYFSIQGDFVDKQILNRDVREFISKNGEILLLYTFLDKNTLLITTQEEALIESINRIDKLTYVR